ncbi:hypothetical protein SEA_DELORIS_7 [Mycobacterium phage Deloris]|nr:hypothetical protein SEA_DELORIS_7 [Mycobacterium phage Deloris]
MRLRGIPPAGPALSYVGRPEGKFHGTAKPLVSSLSDPRLRGTNLLPNADFSDISYWQLPFPDKQVYDFTEGRRSPGSIKIGPAASDNLWFGGQIVPATPGEELYLSVWAKHSGIGIYAGISLAIALFADAEGAQFIDTPTLTNLPAVDQPIDWTQITARYVVGPNVHGVAFVPALFAISGTAWFDEAWMSRVSYPNPTKLK